ncbi:MAG: dodecin domain-containing protein [Ignavibacteriae bacterium]|nr:dodecin domain-containing protein [Ignavibacteriota bacterium]
MSNECASEAIKTVILEAHKEKNVSWFEVLEQRGRVIPGDEIEFQVSVKLGRKINN